jgi:hypothetical protein
MKTCLGAYPARVPRFALDMPAILVYGTGVSANPVDRHEFYARFPAAIYGKLRKLAGMGPVKVEEERKPLLLRLPQATYHDLRMLTLKRSTDEDDMLSIQEVLSDLIDKSESVKPAARASMVQVVVRIVDAAAHPPKNGKRAAATAKPAATRTRTPRAAAPRAPESA